MAARTASNPTPNRGGGEAEAGAEAEAAPATAPARPWRALAGRAWLGESGALRAVVTPLVDAGAAGGTLLRGAVEAPLPAWLAAALGPATPALPPPGAAAVVAPADPLPLPFRRVICSATLTSNPQKLAALGLDPVGSTGAETKAQIERDIPKWAQVIKDAGIPRN